MNALDVAAADARLSEAFYGTVLLHEPVCVPWSPDLYNGLTGMIKVISAKDLVGTEVNSRDSNWAVLITGPGVTMGLPGCQVRMVVRRNDPAQQWNLNPAITDVP
jgi:hypothetical protein